MQVGYARVSTSEQDTRMQLDALQRAGVAKVFAEKRSGGSTLQRLELARMLEQLRPGDVVAVYKLDRLARSLADLLRILATIEAAGAAFRSLTEPIDTGSPAGRMLMQLLGAFAEFERGIIRERSIAGQQAARERGVHCGRHAVLTLQEAKKARDLYRSGRTTLTALAKLYGCHPSSIKRAMRRADSA